MLHLGLSPTGINNLMGSGSSATPSYLDSVVNSACFDLDSRILASYSGTGETWSNLITNPADGSNQTDYDLWLGLDGTTDGNEPTFDTDKWTATGGKSFNSKLAENTDLVQRMILESGNYAWWLSFGFVVPASTRTLFDSSQWTTNPYNAGFIITFQNTSNGRIVLGYRNDSGNSQNTIFFNSTGIVFTEGASVNVIITREANSTNIKAFYNTIEESTTINISGTKTNLATVPYTILGRNGINFGGTTGETAIDFMHVGLGNEYLDNTKAEAIIANLNDR